MIRFCFTFWAALLLNAPIVCAEDNISQIRTLRVPADVSTSLSLDGFVAVALFKNDTATLQDMLGPAVVFSPISGHEINLGFVQTSVWIRFALMQSPDADGPQNLLLSVTPNFTDELAVYVGSLDENMLAANFDKYEMGDHSPNSHMLFNTSANILPLTLSPGKATAVYMRARNQDASLNLSVELMSPSEYEYKSILRNIIRGTWFGGMGILLIIQMFFLYFDRKKIYLLLAFDILAVSSTYFGSLGLARLLFFSNGGFGNDYLTSSASWLGLTAGALSITGLFELKSRYPRLDLFCQLAAIVGLAGVLCVFAGVNRYFVMVAGPVILLLTTLAVVVTYLDYNRTRGARHALNLTAFSLLWAGLLITNSQRYGLLPLPSWLAASYAVTGILHFTFLTGSLAVRFREADIAIREADRLRLLAASSEIALSAELEAQKQQVRFMEVISHQYRTPLGVIRTNLESIRMTLPKDDVANRNRLVCANVGVERLVEVLEVNLRRSKMQGPSYKPDRVHMSVVDIATAVLASAKDVLPALEVSFRMTEEAERAKILADEEMLKLALINLLENAFKFSAPVKSVTVGFDVFCLDEEIYLQITDRGIGMPEGSLDALFERNVRGTNSVHVEGTGLGLSLVKRTVDAHGGRFLLRRRTSGGTMATIILPRTTGQ